MIHQHRSESGQAIIIITLAMVVLLGFTAVAVDGSMAYSDRRYAQSVSDSSAMAGVTAAANIINQNNLTTGTWDCNSPVVQAAITAARSAAISGAAANHMTIDANITDHNGVKVTCVDTATEKYLDVLTQVSMQSAPGFSATVYHGVLGNQVAASARVYPKKALAFGYTIVALNPAACQGQQNGATFHGNPNVKVCGGGIYTNGCLRGNGNISVDVKDSSCAPVSEGIYYATDLSGGSLFSPAPKSAPHITGDEFSLPFTPQELCKRPGAVSIDADDLPTTLEKGLYCISGSLKFSGKKGKLHGKGVTLVFLDGGMDCNGNCELQLSAPGASPDPYPAVPGLLIYTMAADSWKLNGNNNTYFQGTILAPKADIAMLGTGNEESFKTQVICYNFEGGGTNDSVFKWYDDLMYSKPVELELHR